MDYYENTTGITSTSAVRAASYVVQLVPNSFEPDSVVASSIVSWGRVSVGKSFVFMPSSTKAVFLPDPARATSTSSTGLFFGADLTPLQILAFVEQGDNPVVPSSGGEGGGLKFYWG